MNWIPTCASIKLVAIIFSTKTDALFLHTFLPFYLRSPYSCIKIHVSGHFVLVFTVENDFFGMSLLITKCEVYGQRISRPPRRSRPRMEACITEDEEENDDEDD